MKDWTSTIKPGQYVLGQDVVNPRPDRRQRYDWRASSRWPKGMEFTVREEKGFAAPTRSLSETWGRYTATQVLYLHNTEDGRLGALLPYLLPAERSGALDLKQALQSRGWDESHAFAVLARLLDAKSKVDILDIEELLDAEQAEEDAAEKQRTADGGA